METVKFEITEEDVKKYLKNHKNDVNIKHKEAMFVKYIRENRNFSQEMLEIFMKKDIKPYGSLEKRIEFINLDKSNCLETFEHYLKIENLNLSGICHILIPTLGYYDFCRTSHSFVTKDSISLNNLYDKIWDINPHLEFGTSKQLANFESEINLAVNDYRIADKIENHFLYKTYIDNQIRVNMSKENCIEELKAYKEIYGDTAVELIREHVKKLVK